MVLAFMVASLDRGLGGSAARHLALARILYTKTSQPAKNSDARGLLMLMQNDREVVLVTGFTGLIGAAVAAALTARGDDVLGLDRVASASAPCPVMLHELGDAHRLHEIMQTVRVRAIIHAGGASGPMVSPESPGRIAAVNIGGLVDMLEAARIHHVPRVVWFSSIMAYGPQAMDQQIDEDTLLRPDTVYGATKAAGEALLHAYAAEHGIDGVALRVASCYGPGRTTNCFVRLLVENARAGKPTLVPALDDRNRQHIHTNDVVAATLAVLDTPHLPSLAYNIGPGFALTSREVADEVSRAVEGVHLEHDPAAPNWNSFGLGPLSIARAQEDFGFQPKVGLAEGAATYLRYMGHGILA
jgi:nucleoside-diphosphate-sugar epimerase